ncbi:hypothetical protein JKP88DRAFT_351430 [Tribonema minus]|uniref:EF-hand domain-containing protein n=1 Tax=Tribonema minus TaxID=303371 RepID=A0A835YKI0_9STRA|nr:hypothetical protein JKP88DRAFT_351430 [Tribonema minus]
MGNRASAPSGDSKPGSQESAQGVGGGATAATTETQKDNLATAGSELDELRKAFGSIAGASGALDFDALLKVDEVASQLAAGDLCTEDVEAMWLEAVSCPGATSLEPGAEMGPSSWGVRTPLNFRGFLELIRVCEEKTASLGAQPGEVAATYERPVQLVAGAAATQRARWQIAMARQHLAGLMRATLVLHGRGGVASAGGGEADGAAAKALHLEALRAAVERGLARRGSLSRGELLQRAGGSGGGRDDASSAAGERGLMRRGSLLRGELLQRAGGGRGRDDASVSAQARSLGQQLTRASLHRALKSARSRGELVAQGVLLEQTPTGRALELNIKKDMLKHGLEARPAPEDLKLNIKKDMLKHGRQARPAPEDLKAAVIPKQASPQSAAAEMALLQARLPNSAIAAAILKQASPQFAAAEMALLQARLSHALAARPDADALSAAHVLLPEDAAGRARMEHQIAGAQVARGLAQRPGVDELKRPNVDGLKDAGVYQDGSAAAKQLEAQMLRDALKHRLEDPQRPTAEALEGQGVRLPEHQGFEHLRAGVQSVAAVEALEGQGVRLPEHQGFKHLRVGVQVKHGLEGRASLGDVKALGIYLEPEEAQAAAAERKRAAAALQQGCWRAPASRSCRRRALPYAAAVERERAAAALQQGLSASASIAQLQADHTLSPRAAAAAERERAAAALQQGLSARAGVAELQAQGIYVTPLDAMRAQLEHSMTCDALSHALAPGGRRPSVESLKAAGIMREGGAAQVALEKAMVADQVAAGLRSRPTPAEAADRGLITADGAPVLDDAEQQKHEAMKRRQDLMAAQVGEQLAKREPLENLSNKGIYMTATPQARGVERAFVTHKLAGALAHRPDQEQLENKGVLMGLESPAQVREQHREARNALEGALATRPSYAELEEQGYLEVDQLELEEQGYLEVDQLEAWFNEMAEQQQNGSAAAAAPTVPCSAVEACEQVQAMVTAGTTTKEAIAATLQEVDAAGAGRLTFAQFLTFVDAIDVKAEGDVGAEEDGSSGGSSGDGDEASKQQRLANKRARALAAAQAPSLTERLVAHLRARPARDAPDIQRIAHGFRSGAADSLRAALVGQHLAHLLSRREDLDALRRRGVATEQTAAARELEYRLNQRLLDRRLRRRPSADELVRWGVMPQEGQDSVQQRAAAAGVALAQSMADRPACADLEARGILQTEAAQRGGAATEAAQRGGAAEGLDAEELAARQDALAHQLAARASVRDLKQQGIYLGIYLDETAAVARQLEQQLLRAALKHKLEDPLRPSAADLEAAHILVEAGPAGLSKREMEVMVAARQRVDLRLKWWLKSEFVLGATHMLVAAGLDECELEVMVAARQVKRGLLNRPDLEDLRAQGIYLDTTATQAAHERLLKGALIARGLSKHFNREELEQLKQKGIYKEQGGSRLRAEHSIIAAQLSRLMRARPDVEALQEEHPHILPDIEALQKEHPRILEANELALAFQDRLSSPDAQTLSFEALRDWPALREALKEADLMHPEALKEADLMGSFDSCVTRLLAPRSRTLARATRKCYREGSFDACDAPVRACAPQAYFDVCDADADGAITFSEFLRFVELCDINPEAHIEADDDALAAAFQRLSTAAEGGEGGGGSRVSLAVACEYKRLSVAVDGGGERVSLAAACEHKLVQRWAASAALDRKALTELFGNAAGADAASPVQDQAGFVAFCRACQTAAAEAHAYRVQRMRSAASAEGEAARDTLRQTLVKKLQARPDYRELCERHIVLGAAPAAALLERNLIANSIKQQLLARPALDELVRQGILLPSDTAAQHADAAAQLEQRLSMRKDDALWRARPAELGAGHRHAVSEQLSGALSKRASMQELENQGIYLPADATGVAYTLMIDAIIDVQKSFSVSAAALIRHQS